MTRYSFWTAEGFYLAEGEGVTLPVAALNAGISLTEILLGQVVVETEGECC